MFDQAGWRAGALAFAGLVAVGLLPLVALLAPGPEASGPRVNTRGGEAPAGVMSREFVLFLIGNATLGYLMLLPTHQVAHLLEAGFSPMVAATTAGLWGAMTAVGGVIGGRALERWPAGRLGAIGTILFAAGMIALILDRPEAIWLGAVYVLAAGLGRGVLSTLLASGQTRAFAGPRLGRLTGLLDLGFGFGAFLGPWLTAVVHDREGSFQLGLASTVVSATIVAVVTTFGSRRPGAERGRMRSP